MTEVEVGITVNGVSRMERIDPRMSLLDLLRERLGLTGSTWDAVSKFRPGTAYLGGGTNLVDLMRLGVAEPDHILDVSRLPHDQVEETADRGLRIGAAVRNTDLAAHPLVRTRYPMLAGGSMGTASWGSAVVKACENLRKSENGEGSADTADDVAADQGWARHSFGAQFAEVQVEAGTGEVRVPRLLGVFAAGRIIDPALARSQFVGGMTMGLGMALMEHTVVDQAQGGFVRRDLPITPAKLLE